MTLIPLVVFLLLLFVGFLAVLRYVLTRYAVQATGHLQTLSQETLAQHESLKRRLEESEQQARMQLAKAQDDASQLKATALHEADETRQQLLIQAREEAERIMQQALKAREAMQRDLTQTIETRALERACDLIREVLPKQLREQTHAQWMDELIVNGLLKLDRLEVPPEVSEARITSAHPLTAAQRKRVQERLQAAAGRAIAVTEATDPRLVAGMTIALGDLVLDGSLATKFQEAARHAQDRLE